MRALLRYLRIEQDGGLHVSLLLAVAGLVLGSLPIFAFALIAFHVEQYLAHARTMRAMETAEKIALAKRVDATEELSQKMAALETQVKEMMTPERAKAVTEIAEKMKALGLRR